MSTDRSRKNSREKVLGCRNVGHDRKAERKFRKAVRKEEESITKMVDQLKGNKDCINCIEWIEGPYADCSKCSDKKKDEDGRVFENDDRAHEDT